MTATVDLGTGLGPLRLPNPVLTASGCAGTGAELDRFVPLAALGGFVTRTVTLDPRPGRSGTRLVETPSGVLHATGMPNPGLETFLSGELPWLLVHGARVVVSVHGEDASEYAALARRLGAARGVEALEVNLSGAHEDTSRRAPALDGYQAGKVLGAVRRELPAGFPVLAKLAADSAVVDVARAAVKAGADGLVLVQGLPALALDPVTWRPAPASATGTLSGPAMHAVAVRCVWDVHAALPGVPLVGVGGVRTGFDALELLLAGASAVQLGSTLFGDPSAPLRVLDDLRDELARRGTSTLADVVGLAHHPPPPPGGPA